MVAAGEQFGQYRESCKNRVIRLRMLGLRDRYSDGSPAGIYWGREALMADDVRISVAELRKRMNAGETFTFLDSRNPQAWAESTAKLPDAIRVPADDLESHLAEIPRDNNLITYCT
jgi:hypothetical protein